MLSPFRLPKGGVLIVALMVSGPTTVDAQLVPRPPITQMDLQLRTVRASGQPVLPIFEGWYSNDDGTYDLCFGFFNLNRDEALDIPIGPDNFLEPAHFNGVQPTHFTPLSVSEVLLGRMSREYCVFTVRVPADIGEERVWWTLQIDGHPYRVPGHITSRPWRVDNLVNSVGEAMDDFGDDGGASGFLAAPAVQFLEPSGLEVRGKGGSVTGPVTARVGSPLELRISVTHPASEGATAGVASLDPEDVVVQQMMKWTKFRGPEGVVSFSAERVRFEVGLEPTEQSTEVTFDEPGDYVLLVQVLNGSFSSQCCWTNAYVNVTVTP